MLDGVLSRDGEVLSEAYRLKGVAQTVAGEDGAREMVQKSVVVRPWDTQSWEALSWHRQATTIG